MKLTPREQEKLMLHFAGVLAKERKDRGVKLNYPEAIAYISMEVLEKAREGMLVADLMNFGTTLLEPEDVMDGVAEMIHDVQIEATMKDGTKLVTVHNPIISTEKLVPGEFFVDDGFIEINKNKEEKSVKISNTGDRPIQVGSHFHIFEVNKALSFDREVSFGFRLDIPSGTAVRFEPGETKTVNLVKIGGLRNGYGLNGLVCGSMDDELVKNTAVNNAKNAGFKGV